MRLFRAAATALVLSVMHPHQTFAVQADPGKAATSRVAFLFDRPGLEVPKFTLEVNEDGSAHYEAEQVVAPIRGSDTSVPTTQHVERALSLSPITTRKIFATARELNRFNDVCASQAKNIADTGSKTLIYSGEGGDGRCIYNYSQDKRVVALTDLFQAIAATLDMGRKLEFEHRFDRLGLDAATARLASELEAGRAAEVGTIEPALRSIAEDSEVMERVRTRAAKLLQQAAKAD